MAKEIYDYENYYQKKVEKTTYDIYIPDSVNENTEILTYSISTSFKDYMAENIITNNDDAIVVIVRKTNGVAGQENSGHEYQQGLINICEELINEHGLNTEKITNMGFSSSYTYAIRTTAEYIRENPNTPQQIIISVDGCQSNYAKQNNIQTLFQNDYDALKENNTMIISYSQQCRQAEEIKYLKKSGLPILFVVDPDPKLQAPYNNKTWSKLHQKICDNFTEKNLYSILSDFALGKGNLPEGEGYIYQVYDPGTKEIITLKSSNDAASYFNIQQNMEYKLKELNNLSEYNISQKLLMTPDIRQLNNSIDNNYTLLLETLLLTQPINNVISKIKNTTYLNTSGLLNQIFESTTQVPTQISNIVKEHYEGTIDLLHKISSDLNQFKKVGPLLDQLDKNLASKFLEEQELKQMPTTESTTLEMNNWGTKNEPKLF